ncbi:hypothetical protein BRC71_00285 [Halobacteriales archaeon QH_7_65_31]|nr:MAG: hypothetical protein BRC71_00285 [Halobacteriales archaeon QH_7_65_31]
MVDRAYLRRALLRTGGVVAAVGLAGCTGDPTDGTDDRDEGGETETATDTASDSDDQFGSTDATGQVTLLSSGDSPDIAVEPSVTVADEFVTSDSPALLRVDVDNPTDDPVTIGEYRAVVFQYVASSDQRYTLLPHSDRSTDGVPERTRPTYPTADGAACWRLTEPIAVTAEYGTVEVPAGGTLTAFVGLYPDATAETCLPAGTYRFKTTYTTAPLEQTSDGTATDESPSAEWGFSLDVESL